ncbi:MAG: redoxin domain-containing protein [Bacteroidetes bacterium]|nr:redoxin domain-containing protein [Bacteroidota bacterium]
MGRYIVGKMSVIVLMILFAIGCGSQQTDHSAKSEMPDPSSVEDVKQTRDDLETEHVSESVDQPTGTTEEENDNGEQRDDNLETPIEKVEIEQTVSKDKEDVYKLEEGVVFPEFDLTDIHGKVWNSNDLEDKVIVFNFWFTSCKPCLDEIPDLNMLVKQFSYRDDLVFIAPTFDAQHRIEKFLLAHPFKYALIPNVLDFNQAVGVRSYPVHLIVDKNRKVHTIVTQRYPTIKDLLANYIYNALEGRPNTVRYDQ